MRITSDELGVVAFVLPGAPNRTFELTEWPDGSFSLEPVAGVDDAVNLATARAAAVDPAEPAYATRPAYDAAARRTA